MDTTKNYYRKLV